MFIEARPGYGCGCPTAPQLTLPLPLPAHIPLGKFCHCTPLALAPTVTPAVSKISVTFYNHSRERNIISHLGDLEYS